MGDCCKTCRHAGGDTPHGRPTFAEQGFAVCDAVCFNHMDFWSEESEPWESGPPDKRMPPAWVVDGSDYLAYLYVTPDFGCVVWECERRQHPRVLGGAKRP